MIISIDDNSKKIVFKHFDQNNVNILSKKMPKLKNDIQKVQKDFL